MSQDNVELLMGLFAGPEVDIVQIFRNEELWAATAQGFAVHLHPNFEVVVRGGPEGDQTFAGQDGFKAFWLDWLAPYDTYRQKIDEAIDLGEPVLLLIRDFGRLEGSLEEVQGNHGAIWTVRDGKITRAEFYADDYEALKAAGLADRRP
jgi:ketosteroid isomerase-like protein